MGPYVNVWRNELPCLGSGGKLKAWQRNGVCLHLNEVLGGGELEVGSWVRLLKRL